MSSNLYTYLGAYLKLTDVLEKKPVEFKGCPTHGKIDTEFCPKCGTRVVSTFKEVNSNKQYYNEKFEDFMVPRIFSDTKIILLPNKKDSGQLETHINDNDEGEFSIENVNPIVYIQKLEERYKEYMLWLLYDQKFTIKTEFGLVQYWD